MFAGSRVIFRGHSIRRGRWCPSNAMYRVTALRIALLSVVVGVSALADPPLPSIPATNFDITTFGALGDGISNNASAIQKAINAAAAVGGGTVNVSAVGIQTNY